MPDSVDAQSVNPALHTVTVSSEISRQHRLFAVSVLIKGVDGVLETIGGILFMFVSPKALNSLVIFAGTSILLMPLHIAEKSAGVSTVTRRLPGLANRACHTK
jgi:hypothetical protein